MKKQSVVRTILLFTNCWSILASMIAVLLFTGSCKLGIDSRKKIIVEATITHWFHRELEQVFTVKEDISLRYYPFPLKEVTPYAITLEGKFKEEKVRWEIYSDQPIKLYPPVGTAIIMHPGDSMHILYKENYPHYSGSNIQAMALMDTLAQVKERLLSPFKKYSYNVSNMADYQDWNRYLDERMALSLPIIESFRNQLKPAEYDFYKSNFIGSIECDRVDAFCGLQRAASAGNTNLTISDLIQIWDSTLYTPTRQWLNGLSEYNGSIYDVYSFTWMELNRQAGFDFSTDSLKSQEVYARTLYNKAKQQFKGQLRERLLDRILDEKVITELGLRNPVTQAILQDYYSQPGYPEFKAWVKGQEKKREEREIEKEKEAKEKEKQAAKKQSA
ncbi:MAG: hypothetical protein J7621_21930 [Niastella sp.]|nr:hypothetical protein [Niastella sp.]